MINPVVVINDCITFLTLVRGAARRFSCRILLATAAARGGLDATGRSGVESSFELLECTDSVGSRFTMPNRKH